MDYYNYAQALKYFLELYRRPVAVRFLSDEEEVSPDYRSDLDLSFCQFVMLAQRGDKLLATADNLACANGAAALGLRPLPEKIRSGEMHSRLNLFDSPELASQVSALTPRIPLGSYPRILLAALDEADFEPQVVILQGKPATLMWVLIANNYHKGGRYSFTTAVSQGVCVDATVIPFLEGNINLSLSCFGGRGSTDQKEDEVLLGLPFKDLEKIVEVLPELKNTIMKRSIEKTAYKRLQAKLEN